MTCRVCPSVPPTPLTARVRSHIFSHSSYCSRTNQTQLLCGGETERDSLSLPVPLGPATNDRHPFSLSLSLYTHTLSFSYSLLTSCRCVLLLQEKPSNATAFGVVTLSAVCHIHPFPKLPPSKRSQEEPFRKQAATQFRIIRRLMYKA